MSTRVDDYIRSLTRELGVNPRRRRRIAAEVADHLAEARERFAQEGLAQEEAEKRAIAGFGAPGALALSFADSQGAGMPTRFTRWGGLAAVIAAPVLVVAMFWSDSSETFSHTWFAEIAGTAAAILGISVIALFMRVRGRLGWYGKVAFRLIFVGFAMALVSGWLWFGPGAMLGALTFYLGMTFYFLAVQRTGVFPSDAVGTLLLAPLVPMVAMAIELLGVDDFGQLGGLVGFLMFGVGWMRVGFAMWREPIELTEQETPAPA